MVPPGTGYRTRVKFFFLIHFLRLKKNLYEKVLRYYFFTIVKRSQIIFIQTFAKRSVSTATSNGSRNN